MHASYEWLKALSGIDCSPEEMARRLTSGGIEVEGLTRRGEGFDEVVVAEVRGQRKHPSKDGLSLVTVWDGTTEREVVCGAPNVPAAGRLVILARVGAKLPGGMEIAERKVGGVLSAGMLCAETELDIGTDDDGIYIFPEDEKHPPGTKIADALGLRDTILEIGLTPNRPDCLGHVGLARELCLVSGKSFTPPSVAPGIERYAASAPGLTAIEIQDPARCPRYGGAHVDGVTVGPSPFWARYRLHCLGIRPISNVVDATNLVMLEHGHPVHAFDRTLVRGGRIVVRNAKDGETMMTLDGIERKFTHDDLLICDAEGPVALAGVMGGEHSGIAPTTKDVLVECAYFDARSVRRTSRRQGLHTDASHRFERGVDPNGVRTVLARTAALIAELGGGKVVADAVDAYPAPVVARKVTLRRARVEGLLGMPVPEGETRRILNGVGCTIAVEDEESLDVELPTFRPDLAREEDLVEEVARVHGYDRIPTTVPRVRPSVEGTARRVTFLREVKSAAVATGLHEAVSYGFVAPSDLEKHRVPTAAVVLANPLSVERSVMRTSLLPGLAWAAGRAKRHGATSIRLFEVGSSFHPTGETLPHEHPWFALFLLGETSAWFGSPRAFDFFDAKGHLEAVVHAMVGVAPELSIDDALETRAPYLHPRRRALVRVAGRDVGVIGELHPDVVDATDLGGRGVYAELDLAALLAIEAELGVAQAKGLPRFPAVTQDLAVVVEEKHAVGALLASVRAASSLVESVELIDEYRGEHVPAGSRSLAFRIVFRDPEATLTEARVNDAQAKILASLEKSFGAQRRG